MKTIFGIVIILIIAVPLSLFLGSSYYYFSPFNTSITKAIAVIQPTKGNTASGIVEFTKEKDGLHVTATITGLKPGRHGFHIHEFGNCACDDGTCAGAHYNPMHKDHGKPTDADRHVGDLGNIVADETGTAKYDYVDEGSSLNGPKSIIGRTMIVHEKEDDFTTQPSGNAGARLGCGVIGIAAWK